SEAGRRIPDAEPVRGRHQARHRQHLPRRAVPVCTLDGLAAGLAGRLPAAAAAAGEFRCAVPQRPGAVGADPAAVTVAAELKQSPPVIAPIAVLGSGSWGTALAIQFARAGKPTHLWGRDAAQRAAMRTARMNARYLPDAPFPDELVIADSLDEALAGVSDVLVSVPSNGFRELLTELKPRLSAGVCVAWATKGFERDTGLLPHQVARAVLGDGITMGVLSGPTFAKEVGAGLPTSMVVASADQAFAMRIAEDLASPVFRTYFSTDIIGVEIGGAVKNVLAVGAGLSDGLG